jgi:hypothetical protein
MIPKSVPLSGTHIAPDWQEDGNGMIYAVEKASDEKYRRPTISSRIKKTAAESTSAPDRKASSSGRHALASKNPNSASAAGGAAFSASNGGTGSESKSSSKFKIFEEEGKGLDRKASGHHENPPQSDLFSPSNSGQAASSNAVTAAATASSYSPTSSSADKDMHALEVMHNRLQNAFDSVGTAIASSQRSNATNARVDRPDRWVTRYVDYTSKYGLGFLLNDGSAGVYFNDSTKSVLGPEGETFTYVERRRVGNVNEHTHEMHTLSSYPESLQKKVTLLKHFRNYLVEQQKKAEEEEDNTDGSVDAVAFGLAAVRVDDDASTMIYLKKWVRTKHAILFRLSNGTVQVVFYDHTEVLLSNEARVVTYVDKKRHRTTYRLDEVTIDPSQEIGKRLKYAKDILKQLLPGKTS